MTNAQEWLDRNYPKIWRSKVSTIYLTELTPKGKLDLADFINLLKIYIPFSVDESKLEIRNQPKGVEVVLIKVQSHVNYHNFVQEEKIVKLPTSLRKLNCGWNKLTRLDVSHCSRLTKLCCKNNSLTILVLPTKTSTNLKILDLSNNNFPPQDLSFLVPYVSLEKLYLGNNKFVGSLDYLNEMKELKCLDISNTDINEINLSKLPNNSLEKIYYSTKLRPDCELVTITSQLEEHEPKLIPWKDIHSSFTLEFRRGWEKLGFGKEQTREWITSGSKCYDYEFVAWLRDSKKEKPEWITNYKEDYQALSDRFRKYRLCEECNELNTGENWCQPCNSKHLEHEFSDWTSGNSEIDEFIQKHQLDATETRKLLEWIPYEQFTDIEYLAEGGFGKVYKAKWNEGAIHKWNKENNKWERRCDEKKQERYSYYKQYEKHKTVVLKSLTNTQNITQEFLHEVGNHKIIDDWFESIVPCYGISQDLQGNYLMVMKYVEGGNLRKYLQKDYHNLSFEGKLLRLINIAQGLKDIHQKDLIHRDFHSGNILSDNQKCLITDLGLSRTVSSELEKEGKILGVLPYVAPEVLRKGEYSQKSDIYSFGIIATEILTGIPPFCNVEHDTSLAVQICQGLRPNSGKTKIPQLLENLIKRCWDAEPNNRPTASELVKISRDWQIEIRNGYGKFYQQYKECEEYNKTLSDEVKFPKYEIHSYNTYTSKPINTKQITERLKTMEYSKSLAIDFGEFNLESSNDWTNIHSNFTNELIQSWQNLNFSYHQTQEWINIGLQPTDYNFCVWLRDIKQLTPEQVFNHGNLQELNQVFFTWWQDQQFQTQQEQPPK